VEEAKELGYDLSVWRSVTVTAEHIRAADLILVMDLRIYDELAARFPASRAKAVLFGLFANPPVTEIADPYRAEAAVTQRVFRQIISAADGLAAFSEQKSQSV